MLHNEHEARERWCYMTLGTNRSKCLASDCMAWRWAEYTPRGYGNEGSELTDRPEERRGFCGLAGLPKF